ncbi:acyclic terpene utilization AtuA family protein [Streptomyces albus subsp. chlorinus]|uniref:acyclic terpene utilization AtuA family protein n=1 Tax=Streptomyces albus TaxID=1888 RepID=UPI00156D89AD|nr:acyclic terpene utilization AtuA family protein [Streptomyces albus]NSC22342.1 acyclic terpene utilization AtuA family protein [Streptomyces albus subsp. chlorinus]
MSAPTEPLRVGNASGFYGDRFDALREMLTGGPLDVLTGDYLAELTMLILGRDRLKDPGRGYAVTFLRQLEEGLGLARERGVALVANAGGLHPAGLADAVRELSGRVGVPARVAHVEGDDLLGRGEGGEGVLTANAYLGGAGIAACLRAGADVVVTGRVADAALVSGCAAAHFGWAGDDWDRLAGAVVAGHVLECGAQATGGNYAFFAREGLDVRHPGFPLAEVHADGSCVVTKHPGTGGAVTVGTVTAQLLYETAGPRYPGPDVTARLDTVRLVQEGPDRVRVEGVRGEPRPGTLKVGLTRLGGFRNEVVFVLTGLELEAKASLVRAQMEAAFARGRRPREVSWSLARTDRADAEVQEEASALLRLVVRDDDESVAGRAVSGPAVELALASYPGFHVTAPPSRGAPYGVFEAVYVDAASVPHVAVLPDGTRVDVSFRGPAPEPAPEPGREADPHGPAFPEEEPARSGAASARPGAASARSGATSARPGAEPARPGAEPARSRPAPAGATRRAPLGLVAGARSGDKGGSANLGVWARDADPDVYAWLRETLTVERLRALLPETAGLTVTRHELPNLAALNFVVEDLLGAGVASQHRFDPQAKALGEWLRARHLDIPEGLLK